MKVIFVVVFLAGLLGNSGGADNLKESVQYIDHPQKNEYAAIVAGSDKHKYGYELKENRHFHHTTTEEDGVRLGCYGYVLFGKKYSTQYVADVKGYRPVYTHDLITVYPKSGGERKASFVGDFNEDQQRSENIRYFFPDGCKGTDIEITPGSVIPMVIPPITQTFIKTEDPITPPVIDFVPPPPPPPPRVTTPSPPATSPPTTTTTTTTSTNQTPTPPQIFSPPTNSPEIPQKPTKSPTLPPTKSFIKVPAIPNGPSLKENCAKTCCNEDDSVPKLLLPVPIKSDGRSGSCERYAKITIPIDGLTPESLQSLSSGADTSELIRMVLQSLQ